MTRSKVQSRRGKQQKGAVVISLFEDVPRTSSSWPAEIPASMTHVYRVNALNTDIDGVSPFASTGPLEMFEHMFQLEGTRGRNMTKSADDDGSELLPSHGDTQTSLNMPYDPQDRVGLHDALLAVYTQASRSIHCEADNTQHQQTRPTPLTDGLASARTSSGGHHLRWHHQFSVAAPGCAPSRSLSPDHTGSSASISMSRRSSLATVELESSRGPSPVSQGSSMSSIDAPDPTYRPVSLGCTPSLDDAYMYSSANALPFAHPLLPQQPYHRPPSLYVHQPTLYRRPAHLSYQDCGTMQRPMQLGSQHLDYPPDIRAQSPTEVAHEAAVHHVVNAPASISCQEQAGSSPRHAPLVQQDIQRTNQPAVIPVLYPLHSGSWYTSDGFLSRDQRTGTLDSWRPHSVASNCHQLPVLTPSQAFKDFMADLGRPAQHSTSSQPLLPPVHAPPLHSVRPHGFSFSVPLRPSAGYQNVPKERDWTAHFEALGRKGRKKRSSRKQNGQNEESEAGQVETYQCPMCDRNFGRRNGLAIHMKWHYKERDEDSYFRGLGIAIPPLNIPRRIHGLSSAAIAQPPHVSQMAAASEIAPSGSTSSNHTSPPMGSLLYPETDAQPTRPLSASTTLLSISTMDSLPGPITPLATPPPSPGGSRVSSLVRLSVADILSARGGRLRSESTRSMWDLFGSDDQESR
ncbi:uncharacterized protein PHACADRAFT_26579 [Phanerochaete carnosa HHB-10118-sp]|uniref:C2H2-type domain-containing protein n=1 Tax=Phanerochaete carnosa (strain HHB-10118-sp) TaxID=650164 RepID=K5V5S3_PHACS|nr:uncharacterized protein PHACADRAFT_26579 [Phanerochaete carnosa HHB-10118-sp]EKM58036.1 hypothetical protein PHACADRAFT_26579 [Phanerochaete carnosa HHB-10118-sp]